MTTVRVAIPIRIFLTAPNPDQLKVEGTFTKENLTIRYGLVATTPPVTVPNETPPQYATFCSSLRIEVEDPGSELDSMIKQSNWSALASFLAEFANRVVRGVRYFGLVPHITELKVDPGQAESHLRHWHAAVVDASGNEVPLMEEEDSLFRALLDRQGASGAPASELDASNWPYIAEAIEENLDPKPEQEFVTNAIEHLRLGNLRFALLESVISVEMVVSRLLRLFLREKGIPNNRVEEFLSPSLSLRDRIAVLLRLAVERLDSETVGKALEAISWRNKIVHEKGHLPAGIKEDVFRDRISTLVRLAWIVGSRADELEAEPTLRPIVQQLWQELGKSYFSPPPRMRPIGHRRILAEYVYWGEGNVPDKDAIEKIANRTAELLRARDPKFKEEQHLIIRFLIFPSRLVAYWTAGKLVYRESGPR